VPCSNFPGSGDSQGVSLRTEAAVARQRPELSTRRAAALRKFVVLLDKPITNGLLKAWPLFSEYCDRPSGFLLLISSAHHRAILRSGRFAAVFNKTIVPDQLDYEANSHLYEELKIRLGYNIAASCSAKAARALDAWRIA